MHIRNTKDFCAGILFILFGLASMVLASGYRVGTASKMGPGYFPFVLGGLLVALGLAVSVTGVSRKSGPRQGLSVRGKPVTLVLASILLFGWLLRPLGLVLCTLLLVMVSSKASEEFRPGEAALNGLVLVAVVVIVFVYALDFQIPVFPSYLSGRH
jgi:hypothetical protein